MNEYFLTLPRARFERENEHSCATANPALALTAIDRASNRPYMDDPRHPRCRSTLVVHGGCFSRNYYWRGGCILKVRILTASANHALNNNILRTWSRRWWSARERLQRS